MVLSSFGELVDSFNRILLYRRPVEWSGKLGLKFGLDSGV